MPCSESDRTGRAGVSSLRTQFTAREWANHPVHVEYLTVQDEVVLAYPCGGGRSLRILLGRESGPPFGLRELTLTDLLLPHLRPVLDAGVAEITDLGHAGRSHEPVTMRQREILHLVALGMPNKQVARHLGLSEGTVRKHLENLYARLGVQSRTEAVVWLHSSETTAS
jgi:DNA-binding CsgD family transcriptional regulator